MSGDKCESAGPCRTVFEESSPNEFMILPGSISSIVAVKVVLTLLTVSVRAYPAEQSIINRNTAMISRVSMSIEPPIINMIQ